MKKNKKNIKIKDLLSNQKGMALLTTLIFVFILQPELFTRQMLALKKHYGI
jgi:ACR3 family arsenite efflux pump ArsB